MKMDPISLLCLNALFCKVDAVADTTKLFISHRLRSVSVDIA